MNTTDNAFNNVRSVYVAYTPARRRTWANIVNANNVICDVVS